MVVKSGIEDQRDKGRTKGDLGASDVSDLQADNGKNSIGFIHNTIAHTDEDHASTPAQEPEPGGEVGVEVGEEDVLVPEPEPDSGNAWERTV